jgi:hypothetical protein
MSGDLKQILPDDFKAIWPGCTHLDCLPTCDHKSAWCARLDKAMDDWNRAHGEIGGQDADK